MAIANGNRGRTLPGMTVGHADEAHECRTPSRPVALDRGAAPE